MAAPVDLRRYLDRLIVGDDGLSADEAAEVATAISEGAVDPHQLSAFLVLLAARGESSAVIFGFARTLRDKAVRVAWEGSLSEDRRSCDSASSAPPSTALLDIVGTGGDGHNSLNISTAASIVAAAGGCVVAKHGSVSVSSRSGSADVLLHLGIPHLPPDRIGPCLEDAGIAFMFAPLFHPALKEVVPVRKALKVRTVFNILGPLLNPAGARRLVLGVFKPALLHVYAEAVAALGAEHALIVHCHQGDAPAGGRSSPVGEGRGGLDELGPVGQNEVVEVKDGRVVGGFTIDAATFARAHGGPVPRYTVADLEGGTPAENAAIIRHLLAGEAAWADPAAVAALPLVGLTAPHPPNVPALCAAIALNAGACLYVYGKAASVEEGFYAAQALLRGGAAAATLQRWADVAAKLAR